MSWDIAMGGLDVGMLYAMEPMQQAVIQTQCERVAQEVITESTTHQLVRHSFSVVLSQGSYSDSFWLI